MKELVKFGFACCHCGEEFCEVVIELDGEPGVLTFPCENCGEWLGVLPDDFQRRHLVPRTGMSEIDGKVSVFAFDAEAAAELDGAMVSEDDLIVEGFFEEGIPTFVIPADELADHPADLRDLLPLNHLELSGGEESLKRLCN